MYEIITTDMHFKENPNQIIQYAQRFTKYFVVYDVTVSLVQLFEYGPAE